MAVNRGNAGKGRPKGSKNKITADVKAAILEAFNGAGGAKYLQRQAEQNPQAFMTLLGKVLPMQVTGADDGPIKVTQIKIVSPDDDSQG